MWTALQDTRSQDGHTSLHKYLALQLCKRQPPCPVLSEELSAVVSPALATSLQVDSNAVQASADSQYAIMLVVLCS